MTGGFEQLVIEPLRRQVRRLRAGRALEGVGVAALVIVGLLAVQLLLDWTFHLPWDMRVVLLAVIGLLAALVLWREVWRPLRLAFGVRELACAVERRFPKFNALLISAVDFHAGAVGASASNSPQLVNAVIAEAAQAANDVAFDEVIDRRPARRGVGKVVAALVMLVGAFGFAPRTMGIWFDRNLLLRDVQWPKRTRILVEAPADGVIRGAIGDDLEIRAAIADGYVVPRQVEIVYESASGKTGRETMTGVGERGLRIVFPRVREPFRFYLIGGDDTTDWFETKLAERPRVETAELAIVAPAYTRLGRVALPAGTRAAEVYPGSTLEIAARCNKPVVEARLMASTEDVAAVDVHGVVLSVAVRPAASQTYHFDLRDEDGLTNARPVRFSVRLLEDEAPEVRLQLPNVGNLVTPGAVLPVEAEFTDRLGLAAAVLQYQRSAEGATPQAVELAGFVPYETMFSAHFDWPMADLGAEIGEQVSVYAQARDFDDVGGPNVGTSTTISFRLVTADELLAEFNRREQEYRRQFERLVDNQERLRGDLLTLLGRMDDPAVRKDLELSLAPLERRQRQIAAQVNVIRQQFEQVLAEMGINRLDTSVVRERIGVGIVAPLTELGTRSQPDAADVLRRLGREQTDELAATVDPAQARMLVQMRAVLDNMLKWEGFQETVSMLREILRLQRELNAETQAEIEREGEGLFDE